MTKVRQFFPTTICWLLINTIATSDSLSACLLSKSPSLYDYRQLNAQLNTQQSNQVRKAERRENLKTCLTGKYPSLCKHSLLSNQEVAKVREAERQENLKTCLTGKYPSLCKHSLLSNHEVAKVREAERQENLETCLTGKYPSLCKHSLLSNHEVAKAREAERQENLETCLTGKYPSLCKHSLLSNHEVTNGNTIRSCEDGHWVQSVTQGGEIVILEDRSIWKINSVDQIDTMLWLPTTSIVVCPYQLINTDDGEKVDATQIK